MKPGCHSALPYVILRVILATHSAVTTARESQHGSRKAMNEDFTQLDDPDLLDEVERTREAVAALTVRYEALSAEFSRRAAAQWTR